MSMVDTDVHSGHRCPWWTQMYIEDMDIHNGPGCPYGHGCLSRLKSLAEWTLKFFAKIGPFACVHSNSTVFHYMHCIPSSTIYSQQSWTHNFHSSHRTL